MIKRIKARNFLSLKDVDVELGPRNVFVGPNMSGKSNLIECIKFLQDATKRYSASNDSTPLQEALSKRGGFSELVWKGHPCGPISFALMVELGQTENKPTSYRYELSLRRHEYGHTEVESEKLTANSDGQEQIVLDNSGGKMKIVDAETITEHAQNNIGLGLEVLGRYGSSARGYGPSVGGRFCDFLARCRFYHLVPALMRQSNPPAWEEYLSEHGDNLSAWLLTLQNHTEEFRRIKQVCCDVLPGLGELLFQPVAPPRAPLKMGDQTFSITTESGKISVGASEIHFSKPISLARMSDGELAFLGLISIILEPEDMSPPLLCIEEPENYLHPRLIEVFVELLNQRAAEARAPQILATTHSLVLIDKFTLEDLVVVDKVDGATRFTRPSAKKHLHELLSRKEMSLGDLWYSGALSDS